MSMASDSVVFACADGIHICKYFLLSRIWRTNLRIDAECAQASESCVRFSSAVDLPLFATMTADNLKGHYHTVRARMQAAPAFMVVGQLRFPKSHQSRKHVRGLSVFIVLLARETTSGGQLPGVQVEFLLGTTGYPKEVDIAPTNAAADLTLYTTISKDLTPGFSELFDSIHLHLYDTKRDGLSGYHLRIPSSGISHHRLDVWYSLITGQPRDDAAKKRPRAPVVELPRTTSMALKAKITSDEITLHIGKYRGGKKHAPICPLPEYSDVAALLSAKYKAPPVRLSEYHLSQNTTEYFQQLVGPELVANAVASVRRKAVGLPYSMGAEDIDDVVGAIASAFYEDIGWRMSASPEQVPSQLSYCSVDIDQVRTSKLHTLPRFTLLTSFSSHHNVGDRSSCTPETSVFYISPALSATAARTSCSL
jgi:hypothetical protein